MSTGKQKIASVKDVVDLVLPHMRDLKTEVFKVVYLDNNNRIIDISDAAIGTVDHAFLIIREIIHSALQKFAKSIVCVHNHPSGEAAPSRDDIAFTKELYQAGKIMQVDVLDHLIIGNNRFYSFADENMLVSK